MRSRPSAKRSFAPEACWTWRRPVGRTSPTGQTSRTRLTSPPSPTFCLIARAESRVSSLATQACADKWSGLPRSRWAAGIPFVSLCLRVRPSEISRSIRARSRNRGKSLTQRHKGTKGKRPGTSLPTFLPFAPLCGPILQNRRRKFAIPHLLGLPDADRTLPLFA